MKRLVVMTACVVFLVAGAACGPNPKDPENELPLGFLDKPAQNAALGPGPTLVGGWAVDDTGIKEVRVYFDGRFVASTTLSVSRPDVAKAMAPYARGTDIHGWNIEFDFGMQAGPHTILAQAVDDNGATRDIGVATVHIPK